MDAPNAKPDFQSWLKFTKSTFAPPGAGVFTVHAARDKRLKVLNSLYSQSENDYSVAWHQSLNQYPKHAGIAIYGIPSDSGGGIQRGANWGPLSLREYLYTREWTIPFSRDLFDLGDVRVNPQLLRDEYLNEKTIRACRHAMFGDEFSPLPVSPLSIADEFLKLHHAVFPKKKLLMLGGDHSVAYPALVEFIRAKRAEGKNPGVLHFDAHTDLLDQRLGIDVCFGSWASHMLKELPDPAQLIQIGIRSSGKTKEHWLNTKGVSQYWSDDVDSLGMKKICDQVIAQFKSRNVDSLYITFDIDALDAQEASATGTPERNGLSSKECAEFIRCVAEEFPLDGADLVEVAPFVHHGESLDPEPDTTLKNASKIIHALVDGMKR